MITGRIYVLTDFFMYQYGSTEKEINERYWGYKNQAKHYNSPCYTYFNSVGWDKVNMILIEVGQFEDTEALRRREGEIIELHHGKEYCLNYNIPGRPIDKALKAYRQKISIRMKLYYQKKKAERLLSV